jgi:hypothetical protein
MKMAGSELSDTEVCFRLKAAPILAHVAAFLSSQHGDFS